MDTASYSLPIQELLAQGRLNDLGPGQPNSAAYPLLKVMTRDNVFAPFQVHDVAMAKACMSGLWLYHDYLTESHGMSQDLATVEGSYWHGLMHRREPDFGNAKYWFRRVGRHAIFEPLRTAAAALAKEANQPDASFLIQQQEWDALAFTDLCEKAMGEKSASALLCRQIQKCEWELLFDACFRAALGRAT